MAIYYPCKLRLVRGEISDPRHERKVTANDNYAKYAALVVNEGHVDGLAFGEVPRIVGQGLGFKICKERDFALSYTPPVNRFTSDKATYSVKDLVMFQVDKLKPNEREEFEEAFFECLKKNIVSVVEQH